MLLLSLIQREVVGRYRGSAFGLLWSLLTPLLMLGVYTFVFGSVFKARWSGAHDDASMGEYAVTLFAGLITFQLFADVVTRAPGLIIANQNFVKKIVFPLQLLVPVTLGSALFHAFVSVLVLFAFLLPVHGGIPTTAPLMLLILIPYCLIILGLSWFLASVGTYLRDIGQFLGTLVTALLFLSPVFFPISATPEMVRPWLFLNPVALPVEEARNVLIFGKEPNYTALAIYAGVSVVLALLGYLFFQKTRKGFADVL